MTQRGLENLINTSESAWPLVQEWLAAASNPVELLPVVRAVGERALLRLQVTTRSPMGSVALETGGLLFDHGWLRILGAGSHRLRGSLLSWNGLAEDSDANVPQPLQGGLLVAHDVVGGFFALNGGVFQGDPGSVFYFGSDTLEWEDLEVGYTEFLQWACSGDLASFYGPFRWTGWETDVRPLSGDQGFSIYPFPWAKDGEPISERSRRAVPMTELWSMQRDFAMQLRGAPDRLTREQRSEL